MTRRDGRKPGPHRERVILGENMVARSLGQTYEARATADLPTKVPGRHRWIVTAAWTVSEAMVARVGDGQQFMDHENMISLAVGCFDCEMALGQIDAYSECRGDPSGVDQ